MNTWYIRPKNAVLNIVFRLLVKNKLIVTNTGTPEGRRFMNKVYCELYNAEISKGADLVKEANFYYAIGGYSICRQKYSEALMAFRAAILALPDSAEEFNSMLAYAYLEASSAALGSGEPHEAIRLANLGLSIDSNEAVYLNEVIKEAESVIIVRFSRLEMLSDAGLRYLAMMLSKQGKENSFIRKIINKALVASAFAGDVVR